MSKRSIHKVSLSYEPTQSVLCRISSWHSRDEQFPSLISSDADCAHSGLLCYYYLTEDRAIDKMSVPKFKVVILGEGRVGKTSILLRYTKGEYDEHQISTLQASYLDKRLMVSGVGVHLSIWDTAGQERFHALGPIYYRDADAALLVYDITDKESFSKVQKWVKELRKIVGQDIIIVIAGNKIDLEKQKNVPEDEAKQYAATVEASHFYTSAKSNKGLEEVFFALAQSELQEGQ